MKAAWGRNAIEWGTWRDSLAEEGYPAAHGGGDHSQDPVDGAHHVLVANAEHTESHGAKHRVALRVDVLTPVMHATVDLHHEGLCGAVQVHDEGSDHDLGSETHAELPAAQVLP